MSKKKKYTVMVGVMFTPETLTQLNEVTDKLEISNSEFIRGIIEKELNRKQLIKKEN
jgi:hypothetical protein